MLQKVKKICKTPDCGREDYLVGGKCQYCKRGENIRKMIEKGGERMKKLKEEGQSPAGNKSPQKKKTRKPLSKTPSAGRTQKGRNSAKGKDSSTVKQKRPSKRKAGEVRESTLATTAAKLSRSIFPYQCHGICPLDKPLEAGKENAAHFASRRHKSTAYLLSNLLITCSYCNCCVESHIWELGKWINKYFGEGTADRMLALSKKKLKTSGKLRKLMNDYLRGVQKKVDQLKEEIKNTEVLQEALLDLARETSKEFEEKFITPNLF